MTKPKYPHNRISALLMGLYRVQETDTDQIWWQIKEAAIEELEPRCQNVYRACQKRNYDAMLNASRWHDDKGVRFTAEDIARQHRITHAHATTVLKQLHDLGLMGRNEAHNETGKRYFEYWVI